MRRFALSLALCAGVQPNGPIGIFEGQVEVYAPARHGSARYDAAAEAYQVSGAGANMWDKTDQFQFLWKKITGNASITSEVHFPQAGGAPHRKAVRMFRQSLDPAAPYVDVAIHGSGLAAIHFRETAGEIARGVRFPVGRMSTSARDLLVAPLPHDKSLGFYPAQAENQPMPVR